MKALSKPLSSPSRAEKFPPPLMRFLRSNVGSRSRGRSRSSPLFYLRSKKNVPAVIETTQEPSSPKVTCIGQVRVRRSANSKAKKTGDAAAVKRRCWWFKKTLFCGKIPSRFRSRKKPFTRFFCLFFRCKKVDDATEESENKNEKNENLVVAKDSESDCSNKYENLGAGSRESKRDFFESCSSSPPKNALILTRCRSAPYRSSSLGGRFWGSPLAGEEEEEGGNKIENDRKPEQLQKPSCENVEEGERMSEEISSREMAENSVNKIQDLKAVGGGGAVHPLILTRCKSEPARTGERLSAEAILTRLDAVRPRSQQNS